MPRALAAMPRKMLPPPMTTAACTPRRWISATSLAIWLATDGIDAELLLAHQGFAGELQEDALIGRAGHDGGSIPERSEGEGYRLQTAGCRPEWATGLKPSQARSPQPQPVAVGEGV